MDEKLKKLRLSFVVPGKLAGMSWPELCKPIEDVISHLRQQNIHTIVNCTTGNYADESLAQNFNVLNIPMANMTAPETEQMDKILEAYRSLPDGQAMAIHCMHGLGRTGTAIACIIGKEHSLKPNIAIVAVRDKRPGSIESEEQEGFISNYLLEV
ncbi:MAG: dual specificity protein phosphatase family protein [Sedimenticola sp.]